MSHNHHDHGTQDVSDKALFWSVVINLGLSAFEFIAGAIAGSVALMADALHNTNDAAALLIAYIARKISRKGADRAYTFGYRRAELIGAMIQLTALILVGLYLVYEGISRFFNPEPILGGWMMIAAGVALIVDLGTVWLLWAMSKGSLNVRAAFLHNLTDAAASVAVMAGGAAVYWLSWDWVDPALTLVIAGYILYMSFGLIRKTSSILMERAPEDLDLDKLKTTVEQVDGVVGMHHLHVWELNENHRAMEAHIELESEDADRKRIRLEIKSMLKDKFDIAHSTLELETPSDRDACSDDKLFPEHG
ncbi:cation diffusion facilitator family transporter [Pelagicoccus enzymogenes]|uniref:cation diffusion facilitator family transporter n=1 Tax=Pelagicoccus enzymogenes TaxID=2773457 RepID=UPI00280E67BD|nr:cation diffusion facilitator family transporter [Pelagicoccus enzymogenes]MDQ8198233.1 cation diffusion facilitator family transporter [Pelagicoccus enzymogenes]